MHWKCGNANEIVEIASQGDINEGKVKLNSRYDWNWFQSEW